METPIYTSGDQANVANYRPISLITTISKIFETLLKNRLSVYIEKHNIISSKQYAPA